MDKRQTVHKYGHIIAVRAASVVCLILVDDLCGVVVYVVLVNENDVALCAIVKGECFAVVNLNGTRLVNHAFAFRCNLLFEETLPLSVGEGDSVEPFQLKAEVALKLVAVMDREVLIALTLQLGDEGTFKVALALVAFGDNLWFLVLSHNG